MALRTGLTTNKIVEIENEEAVTRVVTDTTNGYFKVHKYNGEKQILLFKEFVAFWATGDIYHQYSLINDALPAHDPKRYVETRLVDWKTFWTYREQLYAIATQEAANRGESFKTNISWSSKFSGLVYIAHAKLQNGTQYEDVSNIVLAPAVFSFNTKQAGDNTSGFELKRRNCMKKIKAIQLNEKKKSGNIVHPFSIPVEMKMSDTKSYAGYTPEGKPQNYYYEVSMDVKDEYLAADFKEPEALSEVLEEWYEAESGKTKIAKFEEEQMKFISDHLIKKPNQLKLSSSKEEQPKAIKQEKVVVEATTAAPTTAAPMDWDNN